MAELIRRLKGWYGAGRGYKKRAGTRREGATPSSVCPSGPWVSARAHALTRSDRRASFQCPGTHAPAYLVWCATVDRVGAPLTVGLASRREETRSPFVKNVSTRGQSRS